MAEIKYPVQSRRSKIHLLFAELYLSGGSDDSQEERRSGLRRKTPQKRVSRRA